MVDEIPTRIRIECVGDNKTIVKVLENGIENASFLRNWYLYGITNKIVTNINWSKILYLYFISCFNNNIYLIQQYFLTFQLF